MTDAPTPERDTIADLRTAVAKLAAPYEDLHWVAEPDTGARTIVRTTNDGLLKQLRAAIVGGIGSHDGASAASERLPYDAHASELYGRIEDRITEWYVGRLHKPVHLQLERTLNEWFEALEDADETEEVQRAYLRKVTGWVEAIYRKFHPPLVIVPRVDVVRIVLEYVKDPITGKPILDGDGEPVRRPKVDRKTKQPILAVRKTVHPTCPECGESKARDVRNGDVVPAIVIEYDEGQDPATQGVGHCRFCDHRFKGEAEIAALMQHIGLQRIEPDTAPTDTEGVPR